MRLFLILFVFSLGSQASNIQPYVDYRGALACDLAISKFLSPDTGPVHSFRGQEAKEVLWQLAENADHEYRELERNFARKKLSFLNRSILNSLRLFTTSVVSMSVAAYAYTQVPNAWLMAGAVGAGLATLASAVFKTAIDGDVVEFTNRLEKPDFDPPRPTGLRKLFIHSLGGPSDEVYLEPFLSVEIVPRNTDFYGKDAHFDLEVALKESRGWVGVLSWEGGNSEPVFSVVLKRPEFLGEDQNE